MAVIKRRHKRVGAAQGADGLVGAALTPLQVLSLCEANGISTTPLDVNGLIEHLGIHIKKKPLQDDVSRYLRKMNGSWEITINSMHHPRRQRFTMAHELAHYFLHSSNQSEFVDRVLFRANESNTMEWEANSFAGELLMPETAFREMIASGARKVEDIARMFGVSAMAVRVRAKQLGYLGHNL